jgi:hypothetical protein
MKTFSATVMALLLTGAATAGCGGLREPSEQPEQPGQSVDKTQAAFDSNGGKTFPQFPLRYRSAGRFQDVSTPPNRLVARYVFDMELGVNREEVAWVDHETLIFNVYDLDPSDGTDPDREYFIEKNPATGELECTLNPFPLPNVFSRDWWLSNNMVYQGTATIEGWLADCWAGAIPGIGLEVRFCNRADKYPNLAPLLKKLGPFEFFDYFGTALTAAEAPPPSFFRLPRICRDL